MEEDVKGQDPQAVATLFCEDEEPERVEIPGQPGSWVDLLPMDATDMGRYSTLLSPARPAPAGRRGQPQQAPPPVDLRPATEHLILCTVVGWQFVGKARTFETPEPGRGDPVRARKDALRDFMRAGRQGMSSALFIWLGDQCLRVNHVTDEEQGTEEHPGN